MISIVVPVYNVEKYVEKCIESILSQTYKDIEVLLIDDGSPDSSGEICDRFASIDSRVRVIHTPNRGVGAARNTGIANARGDYIGFVDSDDWLEPDMYETLLAELKAADADICECGWFVEYSGSAKISVPERKLWTGDDTARGYFLETISVYCWSKLYKRHLFEKVLFPEGVTSEDVSAVCFLAVGAERVRTIDVPLYHYLQRAGSMVNDHTMKRLIDYWSAQKAKYERLGNTDLFKNDPFLSDRLLLHCGRGVSKMWRWGYQSSDHRENKDLFREITRFSRNEIRKAGMKGWPVTVKIPVCLSRLGGTFSLWLGYVLNQLYRKIRPLDLQS
ncbi:MAG: glycosyltransferase [Clostridia bacterium]|nr:glycosyltransferase [Clostridia bacterium]